MNELPDISHPNQLCEARAIGKSHRSPFSGELWCAKHALELIHTDVCGPRNTLSIGGNRYLLTVIDDVTRKI